jgi:putative tryptophan/tyrosine transport system substrate-binding protein
MRRRDFIALVGGATTWPLAAQAQQQLMPVIGVLGNSPQFGNSLAAGLKETGYIDGQNVRIEYRWAEGAYDRLPKMANELVNLPVNVLLALGSAAVRAAKPASSTISPAVPIVFSYGGDPVAEGLVASLNRPGGNVTGATSIGGSLASKRLELVRALVHDHAAVALLINPENPLGEVESKATGVASLAISQQLDVFTARNEIELLAVFAALKQKRMDALIISTDNFFYTQIRWLGALSAWHAIPAIGPLREFAVAGGLVSYAASIPEVVRQAGVYVGRILKGAKAADLPVQQPTKFELVINLKTAKALGLTIPQSLLATADEMIE